MLLALTTPTAGRALVNGRLYKTLREPLREVGALVDTAGVHGGRSAYHHLRWLAASNGLDPRRTDAVLDRVGLTDVAARRVRGFSLGMRQRLGIAAALLGDPPTLVLDEPVNGLDPEGIRWIRTLMRRLADEGRTIVVSSHHMNEMEATADHVLVIGRGQLIADMGMEEFTARSASSHVRVVSPDAGALGALLEGAGGTVTADDGSLAVAGLPAARIGDLAAGHGLRLHELTPRPASLEAAFMELTYDSVDYRPQEAS
jgi:ABC-2 type transport system ATP-binding protein